MLGGDARRSRRSTASARSSSPAGAQHGEARDAPRPGAARRSAAARRGDLHVVAQRRHPGRARRRAARARRAARRVARRANLRRDGRRGSFGGSRRGAGRGASALDPPRRPLPARAGRAGARRARRARAGRGRGGARRRLRRVRDLRAAGRAPALPELRGGGGRGPRRDRDDRDPRRLGRPLARLPRAGRGRRRPAVVRPHVGAAPAPSAAERSTSWSTRARRSAPAPTRRRACAWSCCSSSPIAGEAAGPLADSGPGRGCSRSPRRSSAAGPCAAFDHERRRSRRRARTRGANGVELCRSSASTCARGCRRLAPTVAAEPDAPLAAARRRRAAGHRAAAGSSARGTAGGEAEARRVAFSARGLRASSAGLPATVGRALRATGRVDALMRRESTQDWRTTGDSARSARCRSPSSTPASAG